MFKILLSKLTETTASSEVTEAATEAVTKAVTEAEKITGLGFTTENFFEALLWFITGMVGIFMVIGIIIFVVSLLNRLGAKKK